MTADPKAPKRASEMPPDWKGPVKLDDRLELYEAAPSPPPSTESA